MRSTVGVRDLRSIIRGGPIGRPAGWLAIALALVGLALAGCVSPFSPEKGTSVQPFTGVIKTACSPPDAIALQIGIVPDDDALPQTVSISLWNTDLLDAPFVKAFTSLGGGTGRWCPAGKPCLQADKDTVRLDDADSRGTRGGNFRMETVTRILLEGNFRVQEDGEHPPLCG